MRNGRHARAYKFGRKPTNEDCSARRSCPVDVGERLRVKHVLESMGVGRFGGGEGDRIACGLEECHGMEGDGDRVVARRVGEVRGRGFVRGR